ncbi:MAG TPA: pitrilysin family protein [Planctomycetota bacterium]|nr:pitrilysin family protein [Planctomycetota bacterium]
MKRGIGIVFALVLVGARPAPVQDPPIADRPEKLTYPSMKYEVPDPARMRTVLKNGMVVYAIEDRSLPKVDLSIVLRAGSFWEPKGKEGLAGMTGALMRTGGTRSRPPQEIDDQVEFLAAQLSVGVGDVSGNASLSILSKDFDAGLGLLTDILANPDFKQEKIDLWKAQQLDRLKARNDATAAIEGRESTLLLYGDYPVNSHMTKASLDSINRDDLVAYHRRFFHPSAMIVSAAGDFSKPELLAKLEGAFKEWPTPAPEKVTIPVVNYQPKPGVYCLPAKQANVNQGRVTIGHLGIDLNNPDAFVIRIMSYIFGQGGFSSRLVKVVRTDAGLAYSVGCDYRPGVSYTGTFRMLFQSRSESCLYAAKLCLQEMERMQKEPVTEEELKGAISFYMDAFPGLFFATPIQTASTFASAEFNGYPKDYYQTYRARINAVTAADIQRAAKQYMKADKLVFVFVGNLDAIKGGDGKTPVKIEDFGAVTDLPLPDPLTLVRPGPGQ